ncbi:MAG: hypothetical protein Kow00109_24510 [Acidobacteriota bacterium]
MSERVPPHTEPDYEPAYPVPPEPRFLPGTTIEIVRAIVLPGPPRHVLFDFDGTLSLIREGWPEIMVPMMVEELLATGTSETAAELERYCREFVMRLNGKQTIYQMIRLAEEVERRGGRPRDPVEYKREYHRRLLERIDSRRRGLREGRIPPEDLLVPYSYEILQALQERGCLLYLASGTDEVYVREEAALLRIDRFFEGRIFGAVDAYQTFSKAAVIERILWTHAVGGNSLVGFGDGYVEIQNVKEAGGVAVAVASDERGRSGRPDPWKRERLIGAGADLVVPDYRDWSRLLAILHLP